MKGGYGSITEEMIRMLGSFSWFSCTVLIHSEKRKKKRETRSDLSHRCLPSARDPRNIPDLMDYDVWPSDSPRSVHLPGMPPNLEKVLSSFLRSSLCYFPRIFSFLALSNVLKNLVICLSDHRAE